MHGMHEPAAKLLHARPDTKPHDRFCNDFECVEKGGKGDLGWSVLVPDYDDRLAFGTAECA